jgi:Eukaryotic initiation factor 4E
MRRGKAAAAPAKEGEPQGTPEQNVVHPYENSIKIVASVKTVEEFWGVYDYLKRPNALPTTTDYHFFRSHIKPTWEDKGNEKGGKWIIRLPKGMDLGVTYTCSWNSIVLSPWLDFWSLLNPLKQHLQCCPFPTRPRLSIL